MIVERLNPNQRQMLFDLATRYANGLPLEDLQQTQPQFYEDLSRLVEWLKRATDVRVQMP